jgi:hypothetical protein
MKESYGEGLATHSGPETCGDSRKGMAEALTGVRAGRVLSRERSLVRDADAVGIVGRHHRAHRYRETRGSRAVADPVHVRKHFAREPGDPEFARRRWSGGPRREV